MGCDIHAAIEVFNGDRWRAINVPNKWYGKWDDEPKESPKLHGDRNYLAFGILAGVRDPDVTPISEPRGFPADMSVEAREACDGDHSATWLSLEELLAYDWTQTDGEEWYTDLAREVWARWVPLMLKLSQEYTRVRLVMNFDS